MTNSPFLIFKNKIINGARYALVHKLPGVFPFFAVVEYPKSGGSWLGQLLSGYFNIPFPRNAFPKFGMSLVHGHYLPSKRTEKISRVFWQVRDGRDVIVSSYYYYLFPTERNKKNPKDILYYKNRLQFAEIEDIKKNLPEYIEFVFSHKPHITTRFGFEGNWVGFNEKWLRYCRNNDGKGNLIRTSYESLLDNTEKELARITGLVSEEEPDYRKIKEVVQRYSFKNQSGRSQGEESNTSFLRKGIAGDWKNKFSREAAEIFDHYAGDMLVKLGYEADRDWVGKVI